MTRARFESLEEYLGSVPPDVRGILEGIRAIVERTVPGAEATLSYQRPAFKTERVFLYVAGFKRHIGIYPPVRGDDALESALRPYRGPKGNLRVPLDAPMPYALIGRVVEALARQATLRDA